MDNLTSTGEAQGVAYVPANLFTKTLTKTVAAKDVEVDVVLKEVNDLMTSWEKHRNQTITVLTIRGLDEAAPGVPA